MFVWVFFVCLGFVVFVVLVLWCGVFLGGGGYLVVGFFFWGGGVLLCGCFFLF